MTASNDDQVNDRETRIRLTGTVTLLLGGVVAITTILGAVLWRDQLGHDMPPVVAIAGLGLAYGLVVLGGLERLARPHRRNQYAIVERQRTIVERLDRIEDAIAKIAEVLPVELDKRYWRGYVATDAQATGTEGGRRSKAAITLLSSDKGSTPN